MNNLCDFPQVFEIRIFFWEGGGGRGEADELVFSDLA